MCRNDSINQTNHPVIAISAHHKQRDFIFFELKKNYHTHRCFNYFFGVSTIIMSLKMTARHLKTNLMTRKDRSELRRAKVESILLYMEYLLRAHVDAI